MALYRRARLHADNKDYERALRDYDAAIPIQPDAAAYRSRGEVRRSMGDYENALRDLDEAVRRDPKWDAAYKSRGFTYSRKGDLQRALADYSMAISLKPTDPIHLRNRAAVRERGGDLSGALQDLAQALSLDPANAETRRSHDRLKAATLGAPAPQPVAQGPSGRRVALVIGNGAYKHAPALANPANDSGDVAVALRKLGLDVVDGRDLDKRGMEDKIREFARKLDGAELALFFYAGHGLQVGGKNYLVPVDAKLERPGDLNFDALDVGFVLAQMEAEQRVNLVFLDACRDNPLSRSLARGMGTRSTSVGSGLATLHSAIGTMIAYATQPENVALDGEGQRNSPFTAALLKHIATPGLEIGALMRRVRADVVQATKSRQVPWDHSSLLGEVVLAR